MKIRLLAPLLFAPLALPLGAYATDGYFSHGYGIKSQGIGGVGIALPQDGLAAATNPAGIGFLGDRLDVGLTWFRPERETTFSNTGSAWPGPPWTPPAGFADGTFKGNGRDNFLIPELGLIKQFSPDVTLGLSVYGNGGMNTTYNNGGIPLINGAAFGGPAKTTGIDYIQLFVAPTVAWKITPDHSIGVSVNLGYQRFKAKGLDNFAAISANPSSVTGRGSDDAYGIGVHVGWVGRLSDRLSVGATYQSKTKFEKFDKYKGLFAGGGNMDAPATYGIGVAFKATPELTLAADVQRIQFSDVDAIGNSASQWNGEPFASGKSGNLGLSSGPGFGWKDVNVYKVGASYDVNQSLTLRAGYNHVDQPIPSSETLFNTVAPAVVQNHLTLGGTYKLQNNGEVSFAYAHAFSNTVHGHNSIPAQFGGGNADLKMYQDSLGIAYGWNL